ncbi:MAG: hypothetical protein ACI921_001910, partial [Polaribacter sp.]
GFPQFKLIFIASFMCFYMYDSNGRIQFTNVVE